MARIALSDLRSALRYLPRRRDSWQTRAVAISGQTGAGLDDLWAIIDEHHRQLSSSGGLVQLRAEQQRAWMWSLIRERLETEFRRHPAVVAALPQIEAAVHAGSITSTQAADQLLAAFGAGTTRD